MSQHQANRRTWGAACSVALQGVQAHGGPRVRATAGPAWGAAVASSHMVPRLKVELSSAVPGGVLSYELLQAIISQATAQVTVALQHGWGPPQLPQGPQLSRPGPLQCILWPGHQPPTEVGTEDVARPSGTSERAVEQPHLGECSPSDQATVRVVWGASTTSGLGQTVDDGVPPQHIKVTRILVPQFAQHPQWLISWVTRILVPWPLQHSQQPTSSLHHRSIPPLPTCPGLIPGSTGYHLTQVPSPLRPSLQPCQTRLQEPKQVLGGPAWLESPFHPDSQCPTSPCPYPWALYGTQMPRGGAFPPPLGMYSATYAPLWGTPGTSSQGKDMDG